MRLAAISFTERGIGLSRRLAASAGEEMQVRLYTKWGGFSKAGDALHGAPFVAEAEKERQPVAFVEESVSRWAGAQMEAGNALLFIGACGIAVRAVAPHVRDKLQDSPVLVMDETGRYVIPILAGHVGGANEIALCLGQRMGAAPVITTATDLNGIFSVDLFAKRNGLFIEKREGIAKVSAKALSGERIAIAIESGHEYAGALPEGICLVPYPPAKEADVVVTSEEKDFDGAFVLRAREYVIGLGCKKGKPAAEIESFIAGKLECLGIASTQIYAAASISRKREEPGILAWCRKERIPFLTYSAQELQAVEGTFNRSEFVNEQVGVDNVCERAAVRACGDGAQLIAGKDAKDGMTIAVARRKWSVVFDGK